MDPRNESQYVSWGMKGKVVRSLPHHLHTKGMYVHVHYVCMYLYVCGYVVHVYVSVQCRTYAYVMLHSDHMYSICTCIDIVYTYRRTAGFNCIIANCEFLCHSKKVHVECEN